MNNGFKFLLLLLIFLCGCTSKTTDKITSPTNDSIQKYLALAGNDTLPFDKRVKYNDKALGFLDLERNDSIKRRALYVIAFQYHVFNKKEESRIIGEQLLTHSIKAKDTLGLALAYRTLGLYSVSISTNEKAIEYFFKSKKLFSELKNIDYMLKVMMDISTTQSYACDFLGSNNTAFKTLSIASKYNVHKLDFKLKKIIANNLSSLKQNDKAIEYFIDLIKNYPDFNDKQKINLEIASCYIELEKYDKAYFYLNKFLLNKDNKKSAPGNYAQCISMLGLYKTIKGNYNQLPELFFTADSILSKVNSLTMRNYNQIYLSKYYFRSNNNISAVKAAKKALEISIEYKNPGDMLLSLNQLIKVDKKNAHIYSNHYIRINDSMQIAERNFRDKFARIAFETDAITQQKNIALKQRSIVIFIAISILIIAILIFIIARQRLKQKELRLKQIEQKANEDIYQLMLAQKNKEKEVRQQEKKRIGIELHDGIMNKLASTRLHLSILSISRDDRTIESCLNHIHDIQNIEKEIRDVAHDLNQEAIYDSDGFERILKDFTKDQNKTNTTVFQLEINQDINWNTISNSKKMNLYRIIQEACYNINKHAKAQKTTINFLMDGKNVCLLITDDGIGFKSAETENGIGIKNMKHRVKMMKGKFSVSSKLKLGTKIHISIPLK